MVLVYISQGLSIVRVGCAGDAAPEAFRDSHASEDRSSILIRVVTPGEALEWEDWQQWHEHLTRTWGDALLDVLVVSPTQWRSVVIRDWPEPSGTQGP